MQRFAFQRPGANRALDLVNFFVADVQTGFGPFVAVYLTTHKWTQIEIGFALTLGTVTSLISQLPAGVLVDSMRGRSSTWTRIRLNLRNVPAGQRPAQEALEVDYDPWAGRG